VALTPATDLLDRCLVEAPLDLRQFDAWLSACPMLTLDQKRPTAAQLADRVRQFWLPDEVILYIGLATSLSERVNKYYQTPIGERRPHAGGYFLKLLSNIDQLWVHYATCNDVKSAESAILRLFCGRTSERSRRSLRDPAHPFPFANLEWPAGTRKVHGLIGSRQSRRTPLGRTAARPAGLAACGLQMGHDSNAYVTQRVTAADISRGQIRIPSIKTSLARNLLPPTKGIVSVCLRGRPMEARWDPRIGPDRTRSGLLRIGNAVLSQLVHRDEVLKIVSTSEGTIAIL
jgi:hypothetical protein